MGATQSFVSDVAGHAFRTQIHQHHMGVGAAGHDVETTFDQLISEGIGVCTHLLLVFFEFRAQSFAECRCFTSDHMHQRTTLDAREDRRVYFFRDGFVVGDDHAAAWATQGFMGGGGGNMGVREGGGVFARRNQTRDMGHINHKVCANRIRDFTEFREVDLTWDRGTTGDDQGWLVLFCQGFDLIIVDQVVFLAHAVMHSVEPFAGLVWFRTMGQVTTGGQIHTQDGVAWFDQRLKHTLVRLRTGVWLHVGEFTAEQLLCAVDCEVLSNVHILATAIVTTARVAFGVFVGQNGTLGFHHCGGNDVLRGDQFDLVALTAEFAGDGGVKLRIACCEGFGEEGFCRAFTGHGAFSCLNAMGFWKFINGSGPEAEADNATQRPYSAALRWENDENIPYFTVHNCTQNAHCTN